MERWLPNHRHRDTARVLDLPLFEADKIAKLIPLNPSKWNLAKIFSMDRRQAEKSTCDQEDFDKVKELIALGKSFRFRW